MPCLTSGADSTLEIKITNSLCFPHLDNLVKEQTLSKYSNLTNKCQNRAMCSGQED